MVVLNIVGAALAIAGLAMLIFRRDPHSTSKALGVEIRGPAGLVVLIIGATCLVLANFHSFDELTGKTDSTTPTPVATSASPQAPPSSGGGSAVFPTELAGTWTGVYEQSNGKSYRIELVVTGNQAAAQVRYPDLGCFGTATVMSRNGNSIRAQESVLHGECTPTGTFSIERQQNDDLSISYMPDVATYTAHAMLRRQ